MSRQTATKKPEMSYDHYIRSSRRLGRIEANDMSDFSSMKSTELQKEMKLCKMPSTGTKLHMIARLEEQFGRMREEYERREEERRLLSIEDRRLREHPELMLTSELKEESSGISFMDLPGEIRNLIYDLALFASRSKASSRGEAEDAENYAEAGSWTIAANLDHFFPAHAEKYWTENNFAKLGIYRTLTALNVIAAFNKQVRQEVHTFFWARMNVTLNPIEEQDCCLLVCRFLDKIGAHGRSAIASLTMSPISANYPPRVDHQDYEGMITRLRECQNLQTLGLYLPMYMMMDWPVRKGMEDFFLRSQPLVSPSMDDLAGALHSIPKLRLVQLQTQFNIYNHKRDWVCYVSREPFLHFAFSGVREERLVQELRTRLQARQGMEVKILSVLDQSEVYDEWLSRMRAEGRL